MISSLHAERRIRQISDICLKIVQEHEEEAEQEYKEATEAGFDVEKKSVGIDLREGGLYRSWQDKIMFYAQFL